jgi:hypothetical protein
MTEVYAAGGQLLKVRAMMILSLLCALAASWWGWTEFQTHGLRPADGGVLAPLGTRLAWGIGIAALGSAFAAGMWVYGRLYVSALRFDPAARALHFRTVGFVGGRELVVAEPDIVGSTYQPGRGPSGADIQVDAPWIKIAIRGRRLPLILDAQGVFRDIDLAARLLKAR